MINEIYEKKGKQVSNMETNKNINLSWLCINKYLPELDINNIKQTLLKSGVTFFNKFQVDTNKTDISYLTNKNIRIGDREDSWKNRAKITDTAATPIQRNRANSTATLNRIHQRALGEKNKYRRKN